ncbi:diguanylate cyclase [Neobacillus sp. KR4-4]|uniref:sensor domain-containing diguanylate cyclase n=1 Tax=Neobacillus sp. KR4-4 TaxID=3344872 RepID=UPI0035CC4CEE
MAANNHPYLTYQYKDVKQLEKEISKQKKLTRALMNFQNHLIFVIDNEEIIEFNQAFSNFTGISKAQTQLPILKYLSSFFVDDANYFYPIDKSRWFEEIIETGKNSVNMHWINSSSEESYFNLQYESIPGSNQYLCVCMDITHLENEKSGNRQFFLMDSLTYSINQLEMNAILEVEMRRAERLNQPLSMIIMDIDFFKHVNEQFGYDAGDKVLSTISIIVQQRIRESDIFVRWGGEEFILLTPGTDGNGAQELAESIRSIIEEFQFENIDQITCSFGISVFSKGKAKEELILEANHALSISKDLGRNGVTLYN